MLNQIVFEAVPVLTETPFQLILGSLSAHQEVRRGNLNITGFNKPLSNAVFFCHSKTQAVVNRLHSVMAGLFRELERVAVPVSVFPPLFSPAAYVVENISSGLYPQNTGHTAMNTQATGKFCPKTTPNLLTQAKIQDLLTHASQELSHIETISCLNADGDSVLYAVFQHSQRALNALHDLKNVLGIANQQT